ncbi:RdRP-domain-containing protein [Cubamyces menziesii]|nr:RdRP-domain-containing protein [Cubamyces menziesii]
MLVKTTVTLYTAKCNDGVRLSEITRCEHPSARAMRMVDDTTRFLLVSVGKKVEDHVLRRTLSCWVHEGVEIDHERYRFLGFTESQVKEGKLMFFREDHEWTVERLLHSFGNLVPIYLNYGYGKYSARLGLSFSSTQESINASQRIHSAIPSEAAIQIPDLFAVDGSVHTDGCGIIRDSIAARLCTEHDLPSDTTVFQIRRGGIKGLLVRYPDVDFERLCGRSSHRGWIAYRPSMLKYDGGPTILEINNHNAHPMPARLNVQFMLLLLSLGVPFEVFQRLLQDQFDIVGRIITDREHALRYIKGELDAGIEDDFNQSIYNMLLAQHDLSEPYARHRLQTFQKTQYDTLRRKMCLRIPDSCYLFGVVDEAGVLEPDEVYINLPNRSGVLVRDVIVARNPSYHPGDIRKLRAVDHSSLRHHRNCIVFSRTAPRSVPDTIASGDLDGDMYFVCWEPTLLPPATIEPLKRSPALSAAQITSRQLRSDNRQPTRMAQSAIETFIQLRFNRLLGRMANEWQRQAEKTSMLAKAELPLQLVPLIESALDIMKSGEDLAKLDKQFKRLCSHYAPTMPDNFTSPIEVLRSMIPTADVSPPRPLVCDPSLSLQNEDPDLWREYTAEAKRVMPQFNGSLREAIQLDRESDTSGVAATPHDPRDRLPRHSDQVRKDYQSRYFGGGSLEALRCQRIRASAWYYYGYSKQKEAFAWLGERYLNEIKACEPTPSLSLSSTQT